MSNSGTKFTRDEFQGFASCLSQVTQLRYTRSGVRLSEAEFLEGIEASDRALAAKVRAWVEAGHEMRRHVESRQDTLPCEPIAITPSGHAL